MFDEDEVLDLREEIDRLRAELANSNDAADKWRDLFVSNEKAIARVRELCELAIRDRDSGVGIEDIVNAIGGNGP